ncbi:MAG: hypothetical protein QNJ84_09630, partial [Alphaproteobacteria bacterium]|nr:hypothetical protein [Alphaproteobacteria bacterium]
MAVEGSVDQAGYNNGADESFDYISEDHWLAESAVDIPAPEAGEILTFQVAPDEAIRTAFDIDATVVVKTAGKVTLLFDEGGAIEIVAPTGSDYSEDPPLLLQSVERLSPFREALATTPISERAELSSAFDGTALETPRPGPGESVRYDVAPGQTVDLGFSLDEVEVLQTDGSVIFVFPDGAQIVFDSLVGTALGEDPPAFSVPLGDAVSSRDLVELAGVAAADTPGQSAREPAGEGQNLAPIPSIGREEAVARLFETRLGETRQTQLNSDDDGRENDARASNASDGDTSQNNDIATDDTSDQETGTGDTSDDETSGEDASDGDQTGGGVSGGDQTGGGGSGGDETGGGGSQPGPPPVGGIPIGPPPVGGIPAPVLSIDDISVFLDEDDFADKDDLAIDAIPPLPTETGDFFIDFGTGPAETSPIKITEESVDALNAAERMIDGKLVIYTRSDDGLTVTASAGPEPVASVEILQGDTLEDYSYRAKLFRAVEHAPGAGENVFTDLPLTVQVTDSNGDTASADFTVSVTDAIPMVTAFLPPLTADSVTVDEETLPHGSGPDASSTTATGDLNLMGEDLIEIDYGADDAAPGAPSALRYGDLDFTITGPADLTSNGKPLAFDNATPGLLRASAEGDPVFEVVLNDNGTYDFTLLGPLDHPQGSGENTLPLTFELKGAAKAASIAGAQDSDLDPAAFTNTFFERSFTVTVTDDVPTAMDEDVQFITEGALSVGSSDGAPNLLANDALGADGGRITAISYTGQDGVAVSNAALETIDFPVQTRYGELTVDEGGAWTYTSTLASLPPADAGPASDDFSYTLTDADGDSATTVTQPITIDPGPVIPDLGLESEPDLSVDGGAVDEASLSAPDSGDSATFTRPIIVDFGDAGPAALNPIVFTQDSVDALNGLGLSSGGRPVSATLDADGTTITAVADAGGPAEETIFTVAVGPDGAGGYQYTFALLDTLDHPAVNAADSLAFSFAVQAQAQDGSESVADFTVSVVDDMPQAVDEPMQIIEEGATIGSENGATNLLANDTLSADDAGAGRITGFTFTDTGGDGDQTPGVIGEPTPTPFGDLTVNADGTWRFDAGDGLAVASVQQDFTYTIQDADGDFSTATQSIVIGADPDPNAVVTIGGSGLEDEAIDLLIDVSYTEHPLLTLNSVTIANIPSDATLLAGDGAVLDTASGSITLTPAQLDGLQIQALEHSGRDIEGLTAAAHIENTATGVIIDSNGVGDVVIQAVADSPTLETSAGPAVSNDSGENDTLVGDASADTLEGGAGDDTLLGGAGDDVLYGDRYSGTVTIPLTIDAALVDLDGSESLNVTLVGIPSDAILTDALDAPLEVNGGVAAVPVASLGAFSLTFPANADPFELKVVAQSIDYDAGPTTDDSLVIDTLFIDPAVAPAVGDDILDGGAGVDQVFGEAGDDRAVFTVGEGGDGELYDGGLGADTLVIRYSSADAADPAIRAELFAIRDFVAGNGDATTEAGAAGVFPALGLSIQNFEKVAFEGPALIEIGAVGGSVDEDDLESGSDGAPGGPDLSQPIAVDFGLAGPAAMDPVVFTGETVAALNALGLKSGGALVTAALADGRTITAASEDGAEVFIVALTGDPETGYTYTFSLQGPLDHPSGEGEDTLDLPLQLQVTDAVGVSAVADFAVSVNDDAPLAGVAASVEPSEAGTASETGLETGPVSASGSLGLGSDDLVTLVYGADGPGADAPTSLGYDELVFTLSGPAGLTSQGVPVSYDASVPGRLTATAAGDPVFTVALSADGSSYTFTLEGPLDHAPETDSLDLGFTATGVPSETTQAAALDADGDPIPGLDAVTVSQSFQVAIADDGPTALDDAASAVEGGAVVAGDLLSNDAFGADGAPSSGSVVTGFSFTPLTGGDEVVGTVGDPIDIGVGSLTIGADGGFNFTPAAGLDQSAGPVAQTVSYTIEDADGDASTAVLTLSVSDSGAPTVGFAPGDESLTLSESALASGSGEGDAAVALATAPIAVSFGPDGPAPDAPLVFVDPNGSAPGDDPTGLYAKALTSGGAALSFSLSEDGLTLTGSAGDADILTLSLIGDAETGFSYQATLQGPLDHGPEAESSVISAIPFQLLATDLDGSEQTASFSIDIVDDAPLAGVAASVEPSEAGTASETGLETGPVSASGSLGLGSDDL